MKPPASSVAYSAWSLCVRYLDKTVRNEALFYRYQSLRLKVIESLNTDCLTEDEKKVYFNLDSYNTKYAKKQTVDWRRMIVHKASKLRAQGWLKFPDFDPDTGRPIENTGVKQKITVRNVHTYDYLPHGPKQPRTVLNANNTSSLGPLMICRFL